MFRVSSSKPAIVPTAVTYSPPSFFLSGTKYVIDTIFSLSGLERTNDSFPDIRSFASSSSSILLFVALALSATIPKTMKPAQVFMLMTIILSLVSWPGLARVVRSKFISVKKEDFIMAARISGAPASKLITRHMIPSFLSYIIVDMTMSIPSLIIGETTLSFLGLGLRSPATSWGVLLQETNKLETIMFYNWKLIPMIFVFLSVLAFNFMGDGLRDAADPYK